LIVLLMFLHHTIPTLFPYTTLFRSRFHFFEDGNTPSSNRSIRIPRDDDGDGLFDEDGTDDLDGDGNICQMRIKDPHGDYKTDPEDRKSTRLNSSHVKISYAVFCLKK